MHENGLFRNYRPTFRDVMNTPARRRTPHRAKPSPRQALTVPPPRRSRPHHPLARPPTQFLFLILALGLVRVLVLVLVLAPARDQQLFLYQRNTKTCPLFQRGDDFIKS